MIKNNKWLTLLLLWAAFFLNQADRQIFSVVLPLIKTDLQLNDMELGLIASALIWAYGLLVPIGGFAGDRFSRKQIICSCLLFWSTATLFTGLCTTLIQFVLVRGLATGGGEAFYAPAANAHISERYKENRSFALSLHQSAVYFGIILSGLIAGKIAELYGWQVAFYSFGILGLFIAFVIFKYVKKDQPIQQVQTIKISYALRTITQKPTVLLLTFAFGCMVFVNVGYLTWMPSLLIDKFHLSLAESGFHSMLYHHIGAFIGVAIGGILSDRLAVKEGKNRLALQAMGLLFGTPFIYWAGASHQLYHTYLALFLFGLFRGIYDANIFASLYEVVIPELRSSASGMMLMAAFLVGSFSPLLMGILKPLWGLSQAFSMLSISYLAGAIAISAAIVFYFKTDAVNNKIALKHL